MVLPLEPRPRSSHELRLRLFLQPLSFLKLLLPLILNPVAAGFSSATIHVTACSGVTLCTVQSGEVVVVEKTVQAEKKH